MIIKLMEGETLVVMHQDCNKTFVVLEAKHNMIMNKTDISRMELQNGSIRAGGKEDGKV